MRSKRHIRDCPNCHSRDVVPILYGYPGPEVMEESQEGKVHLGGCAIEENQPQKHCNNCGHEWK